MEGIMKKKMTVVFLVVLLAGGSLVLAGDQKPFYGWLTGVSSEPISLEEAMTYPYLAEVIGMRGEPDAVSLFYAPPVLWTAKGKNTAGGKSTYTNAQLFYLTGLDPYWSRYIMEFYEDCTITTANGDQIFVKVEGIYYSPIDKIIAKETVVGGTGRFEGATGEFDGIWVADGVMQFGYIVMQDKVKKHQH